MSLYVGNNKVKPYVGNTEIKSAYVGNQKVYTSRIVTDLFVGGETMAETYISPLITAYSSRIFKQSGDPIVTWRFSYNQAGNIPLNGANKILYAAQGNSSRTIFEFYETTGTRYPVGSITVTSTGLLNPTEIIVPSGANYLWIHAYGSSDYYTKFGSIQFVKE